MDTAEAIEFLEEQVKDILYNQANKPKHIIGKHNEKNQSLLPSSSELSADILYYYDDIKYELFNPLSPNDISFTDILNNIQLNANATDISKITIDLSDTIINRDPNEKIYIKSRGTIIIDISDTSTSGMKDRYQNILVSGFQDNILNYYDDRIDSPEKIILPYIVTDVAMMEFYFKGIEDIVVNTLNWAPYISNALYKDTFKLPVIFNKKTLGYYSSPTSTNPTNVKNNLNDMKNMVDIYFEVYDSETKDISYIKMNIDNVHARVEGITKLNSQNINILFDDTSAQRTGTFMVFELNKPTDWEDNPNRYKIIKNDAVVITPTIVSNNVKGNTPPNIIFDLDWKNAKGLNREYIYRNRSDPVDLSNSNPTYFKTPKSFNVLIEHEDHTSFDFNEKHSLTIDISHNTTNQDIKLQYVINISTVDTNIISTEQTTFKKVQYIYPGISDISFSDIMIGNDYNIAKLKHSTNDISFVVWGHNPDKLIINNPLVTIEDISATNYFETTDIIQPGDANITIKRKVGDSEELLIRGMYNDISYSDVKHKNINDLLHNNIPYDLHNGVEVGKSETYTYENNNVYFDTIENNILDLNIYSLKYGQLIFINGTRILSVTLVCLVDLYLVQGQGIILIYTLLKRQLQELHTTIVQLLFLKF